MISVLVVLTACTSSTEDVVTPGLEARGTVLTTVKPTRQDVTNRISLAGKVTINPVFGIVAPADGELRYVQRAPSTKPATEAVWVATVWQDREPHEITIPKGSTMAGRLLDDRSAVTEGMPIVSAVHSGYGIVAEIDSALAYRISGGARTVRAQIKNGPGPFTCKPLGTIAALPAGTIPEPAPTATATTGPEEQTSSGGGSEATGLRLVCVPPTSVKLINGASVALDLVTDKASNVLVLPVEAIAGVQGQGKVDVVGADRIRKTVSVRLGLTDGKVVEIKSGLTGTETVAIPGPDLPTAAPAGPDASATPGQPG